MNWEELSLDGVLNRNQFSILPSFKLKYTIPVYELKNNSSFKITPFVGYNMFGGKSIEEPNGYKDLIRLQSFEIGVLPTYGFNGRVNIYGGIKGQYIFSKKSIAYGSLIAPIDAEREWKTSDLGYLSELSFNVGAGINYEIHKFIFGIETWFGITDLDYLSESIALENNYRLIIGYRMK